MMETLGELLKKERESQNKNLKSIAKELKISFEYLKALEEDNFDKLNLPEIYKKGILKKYVNYLKLDEKLAFDLYNKQYEKPIIEEIKKEEKKSKSLIFLIYIIVGSIIALSFYVAYKTYSKPSPLPTQYQEEVKTYTPSILTKPTETVVYTPTIKIIAKERTWLRIKFEDNILFEGILKAGESKIFTYSYLDLYVGNAGGLEIFYNDKSLGILGKKGEVIKRKIP